MISDGKKQVIVSGFCAATTQLLVFLGALLGFGYIKVFVASYFLVVLIGHGLLCFLHAARMTIPGLMKYFSGMLLNFPVSVLIMYIVVDLCGFHPLVGSTSGVIILFFYNYQVGKWSVRS